MSRSTSQTLDFAQRLIAHEAKQSLSVPNAPPAAFLVCDKLRPHLATLMGRTGYRTLLCALAVAHMENAWLGAVYVKADGTLAGTDAIDVLTDPQTIAQGSAALVAQLLALLVAFIGEDLTRVIVRESFPKVPAGDVDFDKGNNQ